jgi:hypothetical protein
VYTIGLDTDRIRLLGANKNPKFEKRLRFYMLLRKKFKLKRKGFEKRSLRVIKRRELTSVKGMIGQTIRCKGIQARTQNAKIMNNEDWIHDNW